MRKLNLSLAAATALGLASLTASAVDLDAQSFAGCAASAFSAVTGPQKVSIAGRAYAPKCLKVAVGSEVTIEAATSHVLQGVGTDNPIYDELGGAVAPKTVTFTKPGVYGYYCMQHGDDTGQGMAGAILVE